MFRVVVDRHPQQSGDVETTVRRMRSGPRPSGLIEVRHARYGRGLGRSGAALQSSRENLDQVASLRDRARPRWVARLRYGAARHGSRGGLGAKRG
jgi:hypothetical protein